jgi:hypothetical protein
LVKLAAQRAVALSQLRSHDGHITDASLPVLLQPLKRIRNPKQILKEMFSPNDHRSAADL